MFKIAFLFVLCVFSCKCVELTFKNVTVDYLDYTYTSRFYRIESSNYLVENLPRYAVIRRVDFENQTIPVLYENSISNIEDLSKLTIVNCEVSEIRPGAFKNLPVLEELTITDNKLKVISEGVLNNLPIHTLDLNRNGIKTIASKALNNLPNLEKVTLSHNSISFWNPKWFDSTPKLFRIEMINNSLTSLPPLSFENLVGSNKSFYLDFENNRIKDIHETSLQGLKNVTMLNLDGNSLENFGEGCLEGVYVFELRMKNNNVTCFKGDLSKILKADRNYIDGNPFQCACLQKIVDESKENNIVNDFLYASVLDLLKPVVSLKACPEVRTNMYE